MGLARRLGKLIAGGFRPLDATPFEAIALRAIFAWFVFQLFPDRMQFDSQPIPNGIAQFVDLTFLAKDGVIEGIRTAGAILLVLYVIGRGLAVILPIVTILVVCVHTFANSQGFIHHGSQIVALILLAQSIVAIVGAIRKTPVPARDGQFLYYSQTVIGGVYVIAAIIKLIKSGGAWAWNTPYFAKDLIKIDRQYFYNTLDTNYGGEVPMATWFLENPMLVRILMGGGFLIEILALVALLNRAAALAVGAGLLALHFGIAQMMNLHFRENQTMIWIFLINIPFWVLLVGRKLGGSRKLGDQ